MNTSLQYPKISQSFMRANQRGNCLFDGGRISQAETQMIRPGGVAFAFFQFMRAISNKLTHNWQAFRQLKTNPIIFVMINNRLITYLCETMLSGNGKRLPSYPTGCQCVVLVRSFFRCIYTYLPSYIRPYLTSLPLA